MGCPHSEKSTSAGAWNGRWPQSADEFGALVDAYLTRLVRYAFRLVGNIQDAEDIVHEVLVRAFVDRSKRKDISAVGPYLYRCVDNACIDLLRKRNASAGVRQVTDARILSGPQPNPHEAAVASEELLQAEDILRRLPVEQAEVVRLRVFDELPLSEIAEVVGCSTNTVCSRLRYAFQKLRHIVAERRE